LTLVEAGKVSELEDGAMKEASVQGRRFLLVRVGEKYYAADSRCPHMGGNLSRGKLEGTVVTCPRHGSHFDLRDGRVVRWLKGSGLISRIGKTLKSPRSLKIYNVEVEGEKVWIEI